MIGTSTDNPAASLAHHFPMIFAPPEGDALTEIVKQAHKDRQTADPDLKNYGKLKDKEREDFHQLCWFLSFYICDEISERTKKELDDLIYTLKSVASNPSIKNKEKDKIIKSLTNLRQLKAGGITPGSRISKIQLPGFTYPGSSCLYREDVGNLYKITGASGDFYKIRLSSPKDSDPHHLVSIHDLVFLHPCRTEFCEKSAPEQAIEEAEERSSEIPDAQDSISDKPSEM